MKRRMTVMERREFERHAMNLAVIVVRNSTVLGLNSGEFDGCLLDISRSGLRFTSKELFHRGETIEVIYPGSEDHQGLRLEVKVVRSNRVPGQKYEMATQIVRQLGAEEAYGPAAPPAKAEDPE